MQSPDYYYTFQHKYRNIIHYLLLLCISKSCSFSLFCFLSAFNDFKFDLIAIAGQVIILIPASIAHIGNRHKIGHCFMMSCKSTVVLIENMSTAFTSAFVSNKWETTMTSPGHVTTASLKQANNKKDNRGAFFIRLHFKKFCASILKISHSEFRDPKHYLYQQ